MGSGKSTVGPLLAAHLVRPFFELDERIERQQGRSIAEIFREQGESAFRTLETQELGELLGEMRAAPGAVVALGGGVFAQAESRRLLQGYGGLTVFLDCPLEEAARRCQGFAHRPLAQDLQAFRLLYEQRLPFYRLSDLTVDAAGTPEKVTQAIVSSLP